MWEPVSGQGLGPRWPKVVVAEVVARPRIQRVATNVSLDVLRLLRQSTPPNQRKAAGVFSRHRRDRFDSVLPPAYELYASKTWLCWGSCIG